MGREDDPDGLAGRDGEDLVDFRHVAMVADAVGRDAFVALREVESGLRLAAAAGDAAFAVDDDASSRDDAGPQQRREGKDGRGRIAAGIGDERGPGDHVAIELGKAVDGFAESARGRHAPGHTISRIRRRR